MASATAAGEETSYVFDALGRLVDYDGQATYSYDALDRVAARDQVAFAYAGTEMDPVSDGLATYARTPGGDLLAVQDAAGAHVVGRNRHGDVTHLVAGDGTVAGSRLYDPFGAPLATAGVACPPPVTRATGPTPPRARCGWAPGGTTARTPPSPPATACAGI